MSGPGQPTQDAGSQLLVPISTIDGLGQPTPSATALFRSWQEQSAQIQIPRDRGELKELSETLYNTSIAYEAAYGAAEETSRLGEVAAHDAVDLMDQLLISGISPDEIMGLRNNLVGRLDHLLFAASKLKEEFLTIRSNLLKSQILVATLESAVPEYGDAVVSLRKFLAAAYCSVAFVVPLMSNKAKEFRATANDIRSVSATKALTTLEETRQNLDHAIKVATKHVDEWSAFHTSLETYPLEGLLAMEEWVVKRTRRHWDEIERRFKQSASGASLAKQRFEIANEDTGCDTRRPAQKRRK